MSSEFENIDELFASELKGHSPAPPAGMWEKIEQRIPPKQTRKPIFLLYRIAASIALLLSVGGLGVYLSMHSPEQEQLITSELNIEKSPTETTFTTQLPENISPINKPSSPAKVRSVLEPSPTLATGASNNTVSELEEIKKQNQIVLSTKTENAVIKSDSLINSIEPDIVHQSKTKQTIINKTKKPEDTEAYKQFLSEFESLDDDDYNTPRSSKWALGGQAGPQYTYRQVTSQTVSQEFIDKYDESENGLIAYAGGINIAYKPARRLSIQSGIYYSKMGQSAPAQSIQQNDYVSWSGGIGPPSVDNSRAENIEPNLRVSTSMGDISTPDVTVEESNNYLAPNPYEDVNYVNQYLEFLEIPIMARYAIIDRKINFHLMGGLSTNFLIASPVYLDNGDYFTDASNLNKVNYSSTVGLGLGYTFSSNFTFNIEPQFKYYLNQINTDQSTEVHPYSFGIFTGVTYLF